MEGSGQRGQAFDAIRDTIPQVTDSLKLLYILIIFSSVLVQMRDTAAAAAHL